MQWNEQPKQNREANNDDDDEDESDVLGEKRKTSNNRLKKINRNITLNLRAAISDIKQQKVLNMKKQRQNIPNSNI